MALAKAIGVSDTAICKWENRLAEPKLSYIIRLAEFFNCSADYLIGREDDFGWVTPPRISAEDKHVLDTFHALSPQMKAIATETMEFWKNNS